MEPEATPPPPGGGGAPGPAPPPPAQETRWLWCHDCRRHLAAGPNHDPESPSCPTCEGAFVEYAEDYVPPDPARRAEEALRAQMAQIASQFSNILPGVQVSMGMGPDGGVDCRVVHGAGHVVKVRGGLRLEGNPPPVRAFAVHPT